MNSILAKHKLQKPTARFGREVSSMPQSSVKYVVCECALQVIKAQDPSVLVLVDNCYGEFTEELEPTAVGAGEWVTC